MAQLKAKNRKHIKTNNFAVPKGKGSKPGTNSYPVHDRSHARAALSMVAAHGTPAEKKAVRNKVARKFPGIGTTTAAKKKKPASKAKASTKRASSRKKAAAKRGQR